MVADYTEKYYSVFFELETAEQTFTTEVASKQKRRILNIFEM